MTGLRSREESDCHKGILDVRASESVGQRQWQATLLHWPFTHSEDAMHAPVTTCRVYSQCYWGSWLQVHGVARIRLSVYLIAES
jgi:hypothetical protein